MSSRYQDVTPLWKRVFLAIKGILSPVTKAVLGAALLFIAATISGTILWLLWPSVIGLFPILVSAGIVVSNPAWFTVVLFTWFVSTLAGLVFGNISVKVKE